MNAIIVEDAPQMAETLARMATEGGAEVVATVATEEDGLEAIERFRIDIAIVDLQLAQGTGFGIIRRMRRNKTPACVVVITNHAVPALKVAAFEAGADYFLDKAKDLRNLRRVVAEISRTEKTA